MKRLACLLVFCAAGAALGQTIPGKGNRLAYLDEVDPYYPHRDFPKLSTPQWVGEEGVDAVVVLAIDDMKDHKKYETFLRPILDRLQKIDGRAPVSIMTCSIDPKEPHLQKWLKEGLSLECHTYDHPCPFFQNGFDKAKATYEKCVDLLHEVPNSKPVAFRMPCCDSMNTPSPRFYAEIFNKVSDKKNFLQIDTSVFNVFTSADKDLPRDLVLDDNGKERFRRYLPADRSFVNTIENYPYPYVMGRLCWQFPCVTPSDWQAQHLQKANNPRTLEDWKAALDCTVIKKGVFCLVFHPHGWIKSEQVVELIDHAEKKHGKKVKFLNFREAQERLNKNLFEGRSIRQAPGGDGKGKFLVDVNQDGILDVVITGEIVEKLRSWNKTWTAQSPFEFKVGPKTQKQAAEFVITILEADHVVSILSMSRADRNLHSVYTFGGGAFDTDVPEQPKSRAEKNLAKYKKIHPPLWGCQHARFRDIAGRGYCDVLVSKKDGQALYSWSEQKGDWLRPPFEFPPGANLHDTSLRFLDLDGDGKLDIIFSNEKEYGIYLFENMERGWSRKIMAGKAGDKGSLPMISRHGTDNGFWVHSGFLWWSNEDTAKLRDFVDRRSIKELLAR